MRKREQKQKPKTTSDDAFERRYEDDKDEEEEEEEEGKRIAIPERDARLRERFNAKLVAKRRRRTRRETSVDAV